ncbi:hypothetical protein [Burkholderia phage FLC9]|nr:hypothetical protein [Burkholderia phage FLC9]
MRTLLALAAVVVVFGALAKKDGKTIKQIVTFSA